MTRKRIYRKDIKCPHCGGNWYVNNEKANGKQTYLSWTATEDSLQREKACRS